MDTKTLVTDSEHKIAYNKTEAINKDLPFVVFLGGFMSDKEGSKATFLEEKCRDREQGYIRFDYSGHGQSSEKFTDGTISTWLNDALAIFDQIAEGKIILVGSSMGGWISMLIALARPKKIAGLVLIAAAPDFTEGMYKQELTTEQKQQLKKDGITYMPSSYGDPYPITKELIEDGKNNLLMNDNKLQSITCPVKLLHGKKDAVVPWEQSLKIKNELGSDDISAHFIDDGDHSLSCKAGLTLLDGAVQAINRITAPKAAEAIPFHML